MNTQSPNCVHVTALFVNRTSCAKAVSPSLKANSGASDARLASSTRPSTVTPRAVTVTRSSTLMSVATSHEPGVAQVRVTPSVAMVSPVASAIVPLTAITSPGRATAIAARRPDSSVTVTVGLVGHAGADAAVTKDGPARPGVGERLCSRQPTSTPSSSAGTNCRLRCMRVLLPVARDVGARMPRRCSYPRSGSCVTGSGTPRRCDPATAPRSAFGRRNCLRTKQRLGGGGRVRIEGQGLFNCAPQLCRCKRFSQRPRGSQELGIPPQIDPTGRIPAGYGDYPDAGEFFSNPTQRDDAVLPGHEDGGNDEGGPGLGQQLQSGVAVARFQDLMPCFLQHAAHGRSSRVVVVDHDDTSHGPNLATLSGTVESRASKSGPGTTRAAGACWLTFDSADRRRHRIVASRGARRQRACPPHRSPIRLRRRSP